METETATWFCVFKSRIRESSAGTLLVRLQDRFLWSCIIGSVQLQLYSARRNNKLCAHEKTKPCAVFIGSHKVWATIETFAMPQGVRRKFSLHLIPCLRAELDSCPRLRPCLRVRTGR